MNTKTMIYMVAKSRKKQKNRWNKRKVTTTYSFNRKSILQDIDAFLESESDEGKPHKRGQRPRIITPMYRWNRSGWWQC
jgi:hypothetical protein